MAYYCPEPLSPTIQRYLRRQRRPAVSNLVEIELVSAVARKVREGLMSRRDARRVATLFVTHLEGNYYTHLSVQPIHYRVAREWIASLEFPLRTLDALHLAVAHVHELRLVTADGALARAANAVGVRVHRMGLRRGHGSRAAGRVDTP